MTKGRGDIITGQIGPFHNLVTNLGLNTLADTEFDTFATHCHVGTGNAEPALEQTSLDTFTAGTNNVIFTDTSTQGTAPFFSQRIKIWRFVAGTFNNDQIAEIGVSNIAINGNLFSRALVRTAFGKATTSWVRTDEWLDVTYDFRLYPNYINEDGSYNDGTGTTVIAGNSYDYVIRPSNVTDLQYWDASKCRAQVFANTASDYMSGYTSLSQLDIPSNQPTLPGGSDADTSNSTLTNNAYVTDTFNRDLSYQLGPSALNADVAGCGCVRFHTGMGAYQMSFDPPLAKWYNQLNFRVNIAWANYVIT